MSVFSINISGRINNFNLPKNQPLLPLFEAIVNSFHAIDERKNLDPNFSKGQINIKIIREEQAILDQDVLPDITGFEISDNGIGFNENNFKSFLESDTTYKASIGGKGVGRFSWLKAFEKAEIESNYKESTTFVHRSFMFTKSSNEITDTLIDSNVNDYFTTVKLINFFAEYSSNVSKLGKTIATKIIQHCLVYFLSPVCPEVTIDDTNGKYNLNYIFSKTIKPDENSITFKIQNESFSLLNVKIEDSSIMHNKLFLCANNRVVIEKELDSIIVDLDKQIYEKYNFYYTGVLTSDYLDKNVDMNRLSFTISDKYSEIAKEVSMDKIIENSCNQIELYLCKYLNPIREEKVSRIQKYIDSEAPQFKHLMKYKSDRINKIKPNLSNDKLDDELHKIKREFDKDIKTENAELLNKLNSNELNPSEYETIFKQQIEKVSDANKAALTDYVAHRKIIIDLLSSGINKVSDEKYNKESFIHNLIFPMRSTSNDTDYESHNLWLIDERLAYSSYIASDMSLNTKPNDERPDLLILDNPVAVSEQTNDGTNYNTITIFELKRPMRDNYTMADNPIGQLYKYIDKIRENKVKDSNGRNINTTNSTRFYLYAICDITNTLENVLKEYDFSLTPDMLGYYKISKTYNAYIEVISYNKLINDSKKRNRILFDKLGL